MPLIQLEQFQRGVQFGFQLCNVPEVPPDSSGLNLCLFPRS